MNIYIYIIYIYDSYLIIPILQPSRVYDLGLRNLTKVWATVSDRWRVE
jgi:hypothetical protein